MTNQPDNGTYLWTGRPSLITTTGTFLFALIVSGGFAYARYFLLRDVAIHPVIDRAALALFCIPIVAWLWSVISIRHTRYEITKERIVVTEGVLTSIANEADLYKIRDLRLKKPLLYRLFGLSTVVILTSDRSCPVIKFVAIQSGVEVRSLLREWGAKSRKEHGVREVEIGS